jgi:hypothetical protein
VVLLLISGMSAEAAEGFCLQQGAAPEEAKQYVAEARKRITVAADYARDEQLGKAVIRLDDLYAKSIAAHDTRTALQAQRELNRLLSLYADARRTDPTSEEPDGPALRRQLDLIAAYLVPLKLADAAYPVEEHARVAAEIIRLHGLIGL